MLPILTTDAKIPKGTDPGALIRGIHTALSDGEIPYAGLYFQFAHSEEALLDRIAKCAPILAAHRQNVGSYGLLPQGYAITNLNCDPRTSRLTDPAKPGEELLSALCEIASGISRRFPVQHAAVMFSGIDWGQEWLAALPDDYVLKNDQMPARLAALQHLTSEISYSNMWWVSGRKQALGVRMIGAPPPVDAPPPTVPERVVQVLNRFAKVSAKSFKTYIVPPVSHYKPATTPFSPDQQAACVELTRSAKRTLEQNVEEQKLPFTLSAEHHGTLNGERDTGILKKEIINDTLAPLGFHHSGKLGSPGSMVFVKISELNTRLVLEFDFGTWSGRIDRPTLHIAGAAWSQLLHIPFHSGEGQFSITTREIFEQVITNVAFQLAALEEEYLPALEKLMGPSPTWTAAV